MLLIKVVSLATEEINLFWGFKEQLTRLKGSLTMIQAVLRDAERRQVNEEAVELWLKRLTNVAHDADDVLDELAYQIFQRKVEIRNQLKRKVCCFFSLSNSILFRFKMAHKVKAINMSLETINKEAIDFGLQRGGVDMSRQLTVDRETVSFLDSESNVLDQNMLLDFKCLRVLSFCGAEMEVLPISIGNLVHLRYPDVSKTKIKAWPEPIDKLYNLQTLRLEQCDFLEVLPKNIRNLISLRHLYFDGGKICQMPLEMGQLTGLRTLPLFYVGQDKGRQIEELGCLKDLSGQLEIYNLERVRGREEAERADLLRKVNIYKLKFQWKSGREGSCNDEDVLEGLQPHSNLKGLTILNFEGDRFPLWVTKMEAVSINGGGGLLPVALHHLVKIRLEGCKRCEQVPMLGQLPLLRILKLGDMDNVKRIGGLFYGQNYNGSSSSRGGKDSRELFPALRRFSLYSMPQLVEWMEAAAADGLIVFPCLEKLTIYNCPKLTTAPSHFPCLKELWIAVVNSSLALGKICSNLASLTSLSVNGMSGLTCLPDGLLQNNKYLATLEIKGCGMLMHIAPHVQGCGTFLRSIRIGGCNKLSHLPDGLHTLTSLDTLHITGCRNLQTIAPNITPADPDGPGLHIHNLYFKSLRLLTVNNCFGLNSLPSSCPSLEALDVKYCPNLISFPDLQQLHCLLTLNIVDCKKLSCMPEGVGRLTCLKKLESGPFSEELTSFPSLNGIQHLSASLRDVTLKGWPHFYSLPDQLQHLTALTSMALCGFGLETLPHWLYKPLFPTLEASDEKRFQYILESDIVKAA
ncbi:hypothetical protein F0562_034671 [Nyssa sinensis]|uniref:Uncharacterized protein n=1 Tax=Nyssa sinensis TaxID=561372 RepID=A0A5J5ABG5_9ASTE|nr:hypothetical protein F0562_034671 [Nyssa sinensis]